MSLSAFTSERITAIVSTLMAIAILAAGVTAQQSRAPLDELEQLESDLQFQLDWAFRHDSKERSRRIAWLEETITAWHESPGSEEDRKLLASWLLESTIRSMPGTIKPFPSVPEFSRPMVVAAAEPIETLPAERTPSVTKPAATETAKTEPVVGKILKSTPSKIVDVQPTETVEILAPATTPVDDNEAALVAIASAVANAQPTAKSNDGPFADPVRETKLAAPPQDEATQIVESVEPSGKPVRINLTELTARIAGYHEGLDQVETALLLASSPDLDFLEEQVQKLDELMRNFRFVELYYKALSEQEQKHIRTPRRINATLTELESLLQRHESRQDGDFLGSFDPAQNQRIEELRQQLTKIADFQSS